MIKRFSVQTKAALLVSCAVALSNAPVSAQETAAEIAAERETWRMQCGDPNPDMATGYLVEALKGGDAGIRRICLRETLASDDQDLRSAALRIVVGNAPLIRFRVGEPESEISEADATIIAMSQTGFIFVATEGNPDAGTATWSPLGDLAGPNPNYTGPVTVLGSGVSWTGTMSLKGARQCRLRAELASGTELQGSLQCGDGALIPVTANLLD